MWPDRLTFITIILRSHDEGFRSMTQNALDLPIQVKAISHDSP